MLRGKGAKHAPGSRPSFRQRTTRPDTNEPRTTAERHAADIAVDATTTNLEEMVRFVLTELIGHILVEPRFRSPYWRKNRSWSPI